MSGKCRQQVDAGATEIRLRHRQTRLGEQGEQRRRPTPLGIEHLVQQRGRLQTAGFGHERSLRRPQTAPGRQQLGIVGQRRFRRGTDRPKHPSRKEPWPAIRGLEAASDGVVRLSGSTAAARMASATECWPAGDPLPRAASLKPCTKHRRCRLTRLGPTITGRTSRGRRSRCRTASDRSSRRTGHAVGIARGSWLRPLSAVCLAFW